MEPRSDAATVDLKVRMKEPLRARIESAAKASGQSMNAEAVHRLGRSFVDDELFSSRAMKMWAVLLAEEFQKAGVDAAGHAGIDTADDAWMSDPQCRLEASYSVMCDLIRKLVQQPGADLDLITLWVERIPARIAFEAHLAGKRLMLDSAGKPVMGFLDRSTDDAR